MPLFMLLWRAWCWFDPCVFFHFLSWCCHAHFASTQPLHHLGWDSWRQNNDSYCDWLFNRLRSVRMVERQSCLPVIRLQILTLECQNTLTIRLFCAPFKSWVLMIINFGCSPIRTAIISKKLKRFLKFRFFYQDSPCSYAHRLWPQNGRNYGKQLVEHALFRNERASRFPLLTLLKRMLLSSNHRPYFNNSRLVIFF